MDPDYKYESDKDQRLVEDEIFSDLDELIAHLVFVGDMADLERRLTLAREALEYVAEDSNISCQSYIQQTLASIAPKP